MATELSPMQEQLNTTRTQLDATTQDLATTKQELQTTQMDLQATKQDRDRLAGVFQVMGSPTPGQTDAKGQPMQVLGEGSDEMRRFERMIDSAPKKAVYVEGSAAGQVVQADTRAADAYWRKNQARIRDGAEAVLRDKGFLQGGGRGMDAATVPSDIPSVAFQHLSSFIRQNTFEDLIHWQFANMAAAPGTPPRLNTAVARYPYNPRPRAVADRQLTPGTDITTETQNVTEQNALITIQELGLGKDVNNAPIGIWNFVSAFSMTNLEAIIKRNLGIDYQAYKDVCLYSQWFSTDRIVYNDGDAVATDPTQIVPGDKGIITREFLIALRAYMKTLKIPAYRDGNYGLTLNPTAWGHYVTQLSRAERFTSPEQQDLVTRLLQSATGAEFGGPVSGYRGTHDGFHIFEQNAYGVGAPGDTGTQTVTFGTGVGAKTCDSNFAFGADTIAWATALPVEMRMDEVRGFARRDRWIWYSPEAAGELDVKANTSTGTQLRVIQVRNLRQAA